MNGINNVSALTAGGINCGYVDNTSSYFGSASNTFQQIQFIVPLIAYKTGIAKRMNVTINILTLSSSFFAIPEFTKYENASAGIINSKEII